MSRDQERQVFPDLKALIIGRWARKTDIECVERLATGADDR